MDVADMFQTVFHCKDFEQKTERTLVSSHPRLKKTQ